jgi:hypothetical protein
LGKLFIFLRLSFKNEYEEQIFTKKNIWHSPTFSALLNFSAYFVKFFYEEFSPCCMKKSFKKSANFSSPPVFTQEGAMSVQRKMAAVTARGKLPCAERGEEGGHQLIVGITYFYTLWVT